MQAAHMLWARVNNWTEKCAWRFSHLRVSAIKWMWQCKIRFPVFGIAMAPSKQASVPQVSCMLSTAISAASQWCEIGQKFPLSSDHALSMSLCWLRSVRSRISPENVWYMLQEACRVRCVVYCTAHTCMLYTIHVSCLVLFDFSAFVLGMSLWYSNVPSLLLEGVIR